MNIVFDNYSHNQIVQTPIVVLKGTVVAKDHEKLEVSRFEVLSGTSSATCTDPHPSLPVELVHDKFVLVTQLELGDNDLIVRYDKAEIGRIRLILQNQMPAPRNYVEGLIVHCVDSDYNETSITGLQNKVILGIKLAQTIFSEVLHQHRQMRHTFQIKDEKSCHVLKLGLTKRELVSKYGTQELWEHLARRIKEHPTLWSPKCKYVSFMLDPWKGVGVDLDMQALGGGGLAMLDAQCLEKWPERWSQVLGFMWDQSKNSAGAGSVSAGQSYSKSLGGLVHEMGHIFDLGHTDAGIMGFQYHHCNHVFAPLAGHATTTDPRNSTSVILPGSRSQGIGQISENTFTLTKSSSAILHNHRWFRSCPESGSNVSKGINLESRNTIKSAWPLTVIELRDTVTGLVIESWEFGEGASKLSYSIGKRSIPAAYRTSQVQLVAQNECGTIMKDTIDCCKLPEVFTDIKRRGY